MKYDARTGEYKLFEMNPRQGRSSYFVTAAGYNLARWLVQDVLEGKDTGFTIADTESLWMIAPYGVIRKYLKDEKLLAAAARLKSRAAVPTSSTARKTAPETRALVPAQPAELLPQDRPLLRQQGSDRLTQRRITSMCGITGFAQRKHDAETARVPSRPWRT